jgi:hypothetical protein
MYFAKYLMEKFILKEGIRENHQREAYIKKTLPPSLVAEMVRQGPTYQPTFEDFEKEVEAIASGDKHLNTNYFGFLKTHYTKVNKETLNKDHPDYDANKAIEMFEKKVVHSALWAEYYRTDTAPSGKSIKLEDLVDSMAIRKINIGVNKLPGEAMQLTSFGWKAKTGLDAKIELAYQHVVFPDILKTVNRYGFDPVFPEPTKKSDDGELVNGWAKAYFSTET